MDRPEGNERLIVPQGRPKRVKTHRWDRVPWPQSLKSMNTAELAVYVQVTECSRKHEWGGSSYWTGHPTTTITGVS